MAPPRPWGGRVPRTSEGGLMKRGWIQVLAFALSIPVAAQGVNLGVGAFGGAAIPVVQDDVSTGGVFGIRVPVHVVPLLTVEPFYSRTTFGDATLSSGGLEYTRSGFDVDTFGAT